MNLNINSNISKLFFSILGLIIIFSVVFSGNSSFIKGLIYIPSNPISAVIGILTVIGISAFYVFSKKTIRIKFAQNSPLGSIQISKEFKYLLAAILWIISAINFSTIFFQPSSSIYADSYTDYRIISGAIFTLIGDMLWFNKD